MRGLKSCISAFSGRKEKAIYLTQVFVIIIFCFRCQSICSDKCIWWKALWTSSHRQETPISFSFLPPENDHLLTLCTHTLICMVNYRFRRQFIPNAIAEMQIKHAAPVIPCVPLPEHWRNLTSRLLFRKIRAYLLDWQSNNGYMLHPASRCDPTF